MTDKLQTIEKINNLHSTLFLGQSWAGQMRLFFERYIIYMNNGYQQPTIVYW